MTIQSWPMDERPREKLLLRGAKALSDAELLAIFLRTGLPGKTAVDLSRELLATSGGLRQLLGLSEQAFCDFPGLGRAKYAQLQAMLEMSRRYLQAQIQRQSPLSNPNQVKSFLLSHLRDRPQEIFCCLYMDSQHRLIACEDLFAGTLDSASVYPREVLRRALEQQAAAVIFAHNHPSGVAEPSEADTWLTRRLIKALDLVDIRVLDHLVVGDGEVVSLAERGLL